METNIANEHPFLHRFFLGNFYKISAIFFHVLWKQILQINTLSFADFFFCRSDLLYIRDITQQG